jgi:hypothetical protein
MAGYAEFSAPAHFGKYLAALKRIRQDGLSIELLVYSETAAKEDIVKQFNFPDGFEELRTGEKKKIFEDFFRVFHRGLKEPSTPDEFLRIVLQ